MFSQIEKDENICAFEGELRGRRTTEMILWQTLKMYFKKYVKQLFQNVSTHLKKTCIRQAKSYKNNVKTMYKSHKAI